MTVVDIEGIGRVDVTPGPGQSLEQAVDEIVSMQRPDAAESFTAGEAATATASGFNRGVARTLGAPVDLVNAGLSAVGLGSDRPVGGSDFLIDQMQDVGIGRDVRPAVRPFQVAGEVAGAGASMAAVPLAAARVPAAAGQALATPSTTGAVRTIVDTAARNPGRFAATELSATGGAAVGGGAAAAAFPGNNVAQVAGEIAGGVTSPTAIVTRVAGRISDDFRRGFQTLTPAGQEAAAGREIRGLLTRSGEDADDVAATLAGGSEFGLTSAAASESPTLLALERSLITKDPQASNILREQYEAARGNLNETLAAAVRSGNPDAFRAAAQARRDYFDELVQARIALAEQRSQSATDALAPRAPGAPAAANSNVRNELADALSDAREMERQLWQQIPDDVQVTAEGSIAAVARASEGLLPTETLPVPAEIRTFLDDLSRRGANGEPITSGEMVRLRSRALAFARDARGAVPPQADVARRLDIIADGALQDLSQVPGTAVDAARSFSAVLNERFTAGPAGRLLGLNRSGGDRVAPELALESTVGQGGPRGSLAAQRQRDAVEPIRTDFVEQLPTLRPETITAEQEQFVRGILSSAVNANTGRVSPDRLNSLRRRNAELLDQFPELRDATATAEQAERVASSTVRALNERARSAQRAAFSRVAEVEDPSVAFTRSMASDNPTRDVGQLFSLARRGGEEAQQGARSAFIDAIVRRSESGGYPDGAAIRDILRRHGQQAVDQGVMTQAEIQGLNRVADEADKVRSALGSNRRLEQEVANPSAMFELLASIAGANVGAASGLAQASGSSLILAGRGAAAARNALLRVPQIRVENVLAEALSDPQTMARLLQQPGNARQRRQIERQLNAFALQAGFTLEEDEPQQ